MFHPTPPRPCELCGTVAECRPYGPQGEQICHPCGRRTTGTEERGRASVDAHLAPFGALVMVVAVDAAPGA
jgi:hypothetical protein